MYILSNFFSVVAIAAYTVGASDAGNSSDTPRCMDSARHKPVPSKEQSLFDMCNVYSESSCCTNETASRVHGRDLYDLERLTCNNKPMSAGCKKFFLKDACFYECSPHLGRWIQEENGEDSLANVPLCKSDCDNWFAACINDFTCTKNWKAGHADSAFYCTDKQKCQTFRDKFQSAENFCQQIWGGSYEVVDDTQDCLKIDVTSKDLEHQTITFGQEKNSCEKESAVLFVVISLFLATKFM